LETAPGEDKGAIDMPPFSPAALKNATENAVGSMRVVSPFDFAHWSFALKGRSNPAQGFSRWAGDALGNKL